MYNIIVFASAASRVALCCLIYLFEKSRGWAGNATRHSVLVLRLFLLILQEVVHRADEGAAGIGADEEFETVKRLLLFSQ